MPWLKYSMRRASLSLMSVGTAMHRASIKPIFVRCVKARSPSVSMKMTQFLESLSKNCISPCLTARRFAGVSKAAFEAVSGDVTEMNKLDGIAGLISCRSTSLPSIWKSHACAGVALHRWNRGKKPFLLVGAAAHAAAAAANASVVAMLLEE